VEILSAVTAARSLLQEQPLTGAELLFKRPGIQDQLIQKLRKGKIAIERELDLHGLNSTEAEAALGHFLDRCRQQHIRCARIIHGKGRGSREGRPVIKNKLNQWLRKIPKVLAFCPARAGDGGTGAVYILLKINK
ncbi:MAG: Smr/MutS family protein, partial [Gammaproteobacteria bacterium]